MSALVVDSSSWILYFREARSDTLIEEALREGRVHLPPLVLAELLSSPRLSEKHSRQLEDFLRDLPLVESNPSHWIAVGRLRSKLASKGLQLSTPDAHILQCTLDLNGELLSEDKIFTKSARLLAGLKLAL